MVWRTDRTRRASRAGGEGGSATTLGMCLRVRPRRGGLSASRTVRRWSADGATRERRSDDRQTAQRNTKRSCATPSKRRRHDGSSLRRAIHCIYRGALRCSWCGLKHIAMDSQRHPQTMHHGRDRTIGAIERAVRRDADDRRVPSPRSAPAHSITALHCVATIVSDPALCSVASRRAPASRCRPLSAASRGTQLALCESSVEAHAVRTSERVSDVCVG